MGINPLPLLHVGEGSSDIAASLSAQHQGLNHVLLTAMDAQNFFCEII